MNSPRLAYGDNTESLNRCSRASEENKSNILVTPVLMAESEEDNVIKHDQDEVTPVTEDNELKIRERIAQCKSIIESLKFELNEEKAKLESESKMCNDQRTEDNASSASMPQESVTGEHYLEDFENTSNLYGTFVDDKLNYDENLMEYEKQLQKYQNTLSMAQMEKKNAIRKQMLAKAYKLKLLEVENQCNIELLRVKQSLQCLEPLQMVVNKWKTSTEEPSYDASNFVLIPRYPELSANSGSDVNSVKDENEGVVMDKPEIVFENGC